MSVAPWSFSRLKSFEQCPKQFYHMKIAKDYTEGETDAMRYGTEAHLVAEEYIRDGKPVPAKFAYMKDVLEALNRRRGNKTTEIKMGLTVDLEPCKFRAKDVWWRGIVDLVIINGDKALATFKFFPEIKSINAALIFTKAKKFIKHKYTDDMIDSLWDKWLSKFKRMEVAYETDTWNAHPSGLCKRHCAVLECVYNGSN